MVAFLGCQIQWLLHHQEIGNRSICFLELAPPLLWAGKAGHLGEIMTNNGPQEVPTLQCTSLSCKEGSVASAPVLLGLAVQVIARGKIRYGTAMNMSMKLCVVTSDGRSCRHLLSNLEETNL